MAYISRLYKLMGKTKLTGILMHLEPEKADQLNALAERLNTVDGRKRSELMREAIDDLLAKYAKMKTSKRKTHK